MKEANVDEITRSTNVIRDWSIQLLRNVGFADEWINYINLVFLLTLLALLVVAVQYITRVILRAKPKSPNLPRSVSFSNNWLDRRFPYFLAIDCSV